MKIPGLLGLREVPADVLVSTYERESSEIFAAATRLKNPDVVVIPACNEEHDIPATLLSLSRSVRPVVPIVVENGSSDRDKTYEYACRMGAHVLRCGPAKMRATQVGLAHSRERFPDQPIVHFGDADNLYPKACIAALSRATQKANEKNREQGALVVGMALYDHGSSIAVDAMRSGRLVRKAVTRRLKGESPMPNGCNYAIHVGNDDEKVVEAIGALDPLLFVREESEICRAATGAGLTVDQLVHPSAIVFTRGDLIRDRSEWREFKGAPMAVKTQYYKRNYPGLDFRANSNGR